MLLNQESELEVFKTKIDLRQFAISLGYRIDRRESWRGSTVLRRGADKIVVKRNRNGHYVFFSVRDDRDNGTLIDFLQRRQNLSLGAVRLILRPWIGRSATPSQFPELEPTSPDRMRVESEYRRMDKVPRYLYLEQERCLPAVLLSSPRFAGRMRIDSRGNTVFPHFDAAGLCGYEIKNRGFTGFAAGGEKGLWFSHTRPDDRRLVLAESAIDALSHATLFPDAEGQTRYASLAANPVQNRRASSRRPSPNCRRVPKSWWRSMLMKRGACWWRWSAWLWRTLLTRREGRILFFRSTFRRRKVKTGIRSCREPRRRAHHPNGHPRSDRVYRGWIKLDLPE